MRWRPLAEADPLLAMELCIDLLDLKGYRLAAANVPPEQRNARFWQLEARKDILCSARTDYPDLPLLVAIRRVQIEAKAAKYGTPLR